MNNPLQIPFMYRLADSGYDRPNETYTDKIQNEKDVNELLEGYEEVKDVNSIVPGDFVRYIKWDAKNNCERFILGGRVLNVEREYLLLAGKNNGTFSAQRYYKEGDKIKYETRFFKKLTGDEKAKKDMEKLSSKAMKIIDEYKKVIKELKDENVLLKKELRKFINK